jgi:hypothetical protein
MYVRKYLADQKTVGIAVAVVLLLVAALVLCVQYWPQKKANLAMAYYSDDDGATWFVDSAFRVAPFEHNGKTAVMAEIYTYDDGSKRFCAYLAKYNSDTKRTLERAIADAQAQGKGPNSVSLYNDHAFLNAGTLVKLPGASNPWIGFNDSRAAPIFSIHSPDGTPVDEAFVY